ncbi:MAG: S41 family peptidase [bacterium]|nr:S41 family peptidase [bacterium]
MYFFGFLKWRWVLLCIVLAILLIAGGAYYWQGTRGSQPAAYKTPEEKNVYVRFEMEAYDSIQTNYWKKLADADLAQLFQLSIAKAKNLPAPPALVTNDRSGTAKMFADALSSATSTDAKKQLALNTLIVALYNLAPAGRNNLYTTKQETVLRQEVANVNPAKDLYGDLGVAKGASPAEVVSAYKTKEAALAQATTTEAKTELQKVTYAYKVLANTDNKSRYDQGQIEPTTFPHVIGKTLYISMNKISPTTLQEFGMAIDNASTTPNLASMVLDFRGNIGGSLDFAASFFGLFVGQNQYAFDFYKQGDYLPQRTPIGKFDELSRYKEIAILTDSMTQSTAEVITAMFKHFNMARVVGTPTRGWGTVENTFPLETVIDPDEKYSLLLVRYLTLRDDGQPIEGSGVDPDVSINDKDWRNKLGAYFHTQSLIDAISQTGAVPPLR